MLFFDLIGVDVVVAADIDGFVNEAELTLNNRWHSVVATGSVVVVVVETTVNGIDIGMVHSVDAGGGGVGGIAGGVAVGIGGVAMGG